MKSGRKLNAKTVLENPSPLPQPITKSLPIAPSVVEPSLIFQETMGGVSGGRNQISSSTKNFSTTYAYQHEIDDSLVPSFYETNTNVASRGNAVYKAHQSDFASPQLAGDSRIPPQPALHEKFHANSPVLTLPTGCQSSSSSQMPAPDNSRFDRTAATSQEANLIEKQPWFQRLPHDAYKFFMDEELHIKQLSEEVCKLKELLEDAKKTMTDSLVSPVKVDIGVQVSDESRVKSFHDVAVNTEESDENTMTSLPVKRTVNAGEFEVICDLF